MDRRKHTHDFLAALPVRGRRVVDIGCGDGWCSVLLKELGASVVGVDLLHPSDSALTVLRDHGIPYVQGMNNLVEHFDVAFCQYVLEHQESPVTFLRSIGDVADELWLAVPKESGDTYSKGHVMRYNMPVLVEHLRLGGWDVLNGSFHITPEPSSKDLQAVVRRWRTFDPAGYPWMPSQAFSPYPAPMDALNTRGNNHFNELLENHNWNFDKGEGR